MIIAGSPLLAQPLAAFGLIGKVNKKSSLFCHTNLQMPYAASIRGGKKMKQENTLGNSVRFISLF